MLTPKNILLSFSVHWGQSLSILKDGPVAELVLVLSLDGAGSLRAELPHGANHIHPSCFLQLLHAVVNGAVGPAAANPRAAVDYHRWALLQSAPVVDDMLRRIFLLRPHDCNQFHHLRPMQGDTIVWPCCELEVGDHMLTILQREAKRYCTMLVG